MNHQNLVGQAIVRREDPALLTGRGRYLDDVTPPGTLHAFVVRSPVAHARITGVDVTAAREAPGVAAVLTATDLTGLGPMPGAEGLPPGSANPVLPVLASRKVVWAGQPVALVVAETCELAADAAELVAVDYAELPAVTGPVEAAAPDAPLLHDDLTGNVALTRRLTAGDAAAAVAAAAYRVTQRMVSQRLAPVALEPRGVLAIPGEDGRLDVRLSTQRPHGSRDALAKIFGLPPDRIRVVAGDMGGGFGAKGPLYPDQVAVVAAALALGRPVKWVEERSESFLATTHGRDQVADLEMAADADGRITAIRGTVHASFGAYFTPNAPGSLLGRLGPMLPQGYRIENFDVELIGVFANTTPIGPYRGAGRGRLFLRAACRPARPRDRQRSRGGERGGRPPRGQHEPRPRRTAPPQLRPGRRVPVHHLHRADLRQRRLPGRPGPAAAQARGQARPAGPRRPPGRHRHRLVRRTRRDYASSPSCLGGPGGVVPGRRSPGGAVGDQATVTVTAAGQVTVAVGTSSHGQGHETAFAQLAADLLGVDYADVTVVFGDTDTTPFGYGTFGSRSAVAGGTAVYNACQAALEAARRVDAPMPVADAAARLGGITATASSGAPPETYASGSYGCVVSVDPDTGRVRLLRVVAVDDCGVVINPLLVEGQVHGAVAQGVGQALSEHVQYDSAGQPMSASLMDYAVPFAASLPAVESYWCAPRRRSTRSASRAWGRAARSA